MNLVYPNEPLATKLSLKEILLIMKLKIIAISQKLLLKKSTKEYKK